MASSPPPESSEEENPRPAKRSVSRWALLLVLFLGTGALAIQCWKSETHDETPDGISDLRVKRCIPPQATDIITHRSFNGHFARYRIAEFDFHDFLNQLWEEGKDASAHHRPQMSGEGEPARLEQLESRFAKFGWEPLENAIIYHSPSANSGAMTIYFYDRVAGVAYHDAGYW